MATSCKVVRIDFRAKERVKDTTAGHPLEKLATLIATHINTREQIASTLEPIAAGIRTATLPETLKGRGDGVREKIVRSICQAAARHPLKELNVQLSYNKAEEVLASDAGCALKDVRKNYRDMLTKACLTPHAIPDAATIGATVQDLKTHWQQARESLVASKEYTILSRYLSPEHLKRLIPDHLIEGDPIPVINDLCQTYALYKHICDHLPQTKEHRNELILIQTELNQLVRHIPTVVFDKLTAKQVEALQIRLRIIKATLEKIAQQITPDTTPGNFANITRAREVNKVVRLEAQQIQDDGQHLVDCAIALIEHIETNCLHSTTLYNKLKKWPPELEKALVAYMIDKYKLTGPVRIKLEKALAKKTGTP